MSDKIALVSSRGNPRIDLIAPFDEVSVIRSTAHVVNDVVRDIKQYVGDPLPCAFVPVGEADVLPVGLVNHALGKFGLSFDAAVRTVDRLAMRDRLNGALNPSYGSAPQWDDGHGPHVCAARAMSGGVVVYEDFDDAERAKDRVTHDAALGMCNLRSAYAAVGATMRRPEVEALYEVFMPGPQYEVSGVVAVPGALEIWWPLEQRWVSASEANYSDAKWLMQVASLAVTDLGLSWCGFRVEIRSGTVSKVSAALGEDGLGYDALLRGDHPSRYHRMVAFLLGRIQ
jgi:hypothetical protein